MNRIQFFSVFVRRNNHQFNHHQFNHHNRIAQCYLLTKSTYATFFNKREREKLAKSESSSYPYDNTIIDYINNFFDLKNIDHFKNVLIEKFNRLNEHNFDANFMRVCMAQRNYAIGKAYFDYLQAKNISVNTATLSKFIILCYYCQNDVKEDVNISELCKMLKSRSEYLDVHTQKSLIYGLSMTPDWKDGLDLLQEMVDKDGVRSSSANAMISCSLDHGELPVAISLMETLMQHNLEISDAISEKWIRLSAENKDVRNEFMKFLRHHELFLSSENIQLLNDAMKEFQGSLTNVDDLTGECQNCRRKLELRELSHEQFSTLRSAILEKVLQGPDVYITSNPKELNHFLEFLKKNSPYDVVIDGLNVVYGCKAKTPLNKKMNLLKAVVDHFYRQNKKILVLGRHHMLGWSPSIMKEIKKKCHLFTTQNTSRDDPFMLYAAFLSGEKTQFVSDDILRDHFFRLADNNLQRLFRRWQRSSQLQIIQVHPNGSVDIQTPLNHTTITQFSDGHWHIPYDDGQLRYSYQLPNSWLCLKPTNPAAKK